MLVWFTFLIAAHFASPPRFVQALFEFLVCHYLTFKMITFDTRKVIFAQKSVHKMANIQSLVNHRSSADKESFDHLFYHRVPQS